jgi:predicted RNase H-like nuclease (RuvC/YqgF family)
MGYASYLEDILNRLSDMNSMIDRSSVKTRPKIQRVRNEKQHISKSNKTEFESKYPNDEIKKLRGLIKAIREENEDLKHQISKRETVLAQLKKEISSIIEKNEIDRKVADNRSREILDRTVDKVNDENAEIVLKLKSGIAQIGSIIQQQNFYKKAENINNIKLIIKKMTGL